MVVVHGREYHRRRPLEGFPWREFVWVSCGGVSWKDPRGGGGVPLRESTEGSHEKRLSP